MDIHIQLSPHCGVLSYVLVLALSPFGVGCVSSQENEKKSEAPEIQLVPAKSHEMLILGEGPFYLFIEGTNDREVTILKVRLNHGKVDAGRFLVLDRQRSSSRSYHLKTEKFSLDELRPPIASIPQRRAFAGRLLRNFQSFREGVWVDIEKAILVRKELAASNSLFVFGDDYQLFGISTDEPRGVFRLWVTAGILSKAHARSIQNGTLMALAPRKGNLKARAPGYPFDLSLSVWERVYP